MPRVLVVEEDPAFRELVLTVLAHNAHDAIAFGDGLRALDALKSQPFDLLILELMLPGLTGFELLEKLRALRMPDPPSVLVASGLYDAEHQEEFIRSHLGVDAFLRKPFKVDRFLNTIVDLLYERGLIDHPEVPALSQTVWDRFHDASKPPVPRSDAVEEREREMMPAASLPDAKDVLVTFDSCFHFLQEYSDNIGKGGLFIPTPDLADVGDVVRIWLEIAMEPEPLRTELDAEVVFVQGSNPAVSHARIGMGVQLLAISPDARGVFDRAIEEAMRSAPADRPFFVLTRGLGDAIPALKRVIPRADMRVRSVTGFPELLAEAAEETPDLILMLSDDAGTHATEAIEKLREDVGTTRVPVLVVGSEDVRAKLDRVAPHGFYTASQSRALLEAAAGIAARVLRREHGRAPFHDEIHLLLAPGITARGRGLDLALGGFSVSCDVSFELGSECAVQLPLPDGRDPIRIQAKVTRSAANPDGRGFSTSFEFLGLPHAEQERIGAFVRETIRLSNYVRFMAGAVAKVTPGWTP